MFELIGLFCDKINQERADWLYQVLNIFVTSNYDTNIFLTGSALFFLLDRRTNRRWDKLKRNKNFEITTDPSESRIIGIEQDDKIDSKGDHSIFWKKIINRIQNLKSIHSDPKIGFLLMDSPYFNRNSVFAIRIMNMILDNGKIPELYLYLDGLHVALKDQKPSEFENIGTSIKKVDEILKNKGQDRHFWACSRCATARGYVQEKTELGEFHTDVGEDWLQIVNLNKIIDEFENPQIILSPNSIHINAVNSKNSSNKKPPLLLFITHDPYSTEWAFGAISFAVAAAHHRIYTSIVFIEDGIFSLVNKHQLVASDKIFNIQEVISATLHDEYLKYYVYNPSLELRGVKIDNMFKDISIITGATIEKILKKDLNQRIILF
ncbi:MAG: hypothetical protein GF364_01430 [Candidatus Lokiarchaeota archaeon]|nr:hypothetical protein [Candidatus Lokiarchaeota archaeon]